MKEIELSVCERCGNKGVIDWCRGCGKGSPAEVEQRKRADSDKALFDGGLAVAKVAIEQAEQKRDAAIKHKVEVVEAAEEMYDALWGPHHRPDESGTAAIERLKVELAEAKRTIQEHREHEQRCLAAMKENKRVSLPEDEAKLYAELAEIKKYLHDVLAITWLSQDRWGTEQHDLLDKARAALKRTK